MHNLIRTSTLYLFCYLCNVLLVRRGGGRSEEAIHEEPSKVMLCYVFFILFLSFIIILYVSKTKTLRMNKAGKEREREVENMKWKRRREKI